MLLEHHLYNSWISNLWQKPSFAVSSIWISFIRLGEEIRHHQQSITRNIPKIKALVLWELWMNILPEQRSGDLEKSTPNFFKVLFTLTVPAWLKTILIKPVFDTSTFNAQSVRSALNSKAGLKGAPTEDILRWGFSSNKGTWQRFYKKIIAEAEKIFQETVISQHEIYETLWKQDGQLGSMLRWASQAWRTQY